MKVPNLGGPIGCMVISRWKNDPSLLKAQSLDFRGNKPIHDGYLCRVIWDQVQDTLKVLRLSQVDLSKHFTVYVPKLPASLVELEIDACNLNDADAKELAEDCNAPGLQTLSIRENSIGDTGIAAILQSTRFALKALRCSQADLSKNFTFHILKEPSQIVELELVDCNLSNAHVRELAEKFKAPKLQALSIRNNPIGDEGIAALLASRAFKLTDLDARQVEASSPVFRMDRPEASSFVRLITDYPHVTIGQL